MSAIDAAFASTRECSLHGQSLPKRWKHRAVFVEAELFFDRDLNREVENPDEEPAQLPPSGIADERVEVPTCPDDAEDVQRTVTSAEKMVSLISEQLRRWPSAELGSNSVARIDLSESGNQAADIVVITRVNDVDVEGRDGGALDDGGDPTHDDETNAVTAKNGEESSDVTGGLGHDGPP